MRIETSADRLNSRPVTFFAAVPSGGDAYIMKHIIHDWDDERAVTILKNIKNAMNPGGRVLVVEAVIADGNNQDFGKLLDIEMLVSPGGKERTAAEYEELLQSRRLAPHAHCSDQITIQRDRSHRYITREAGGSIKPGASPR